MLYRLWWHVDGIFVAIMALVAACVIDPGVYFAMNSPMAMLAPAGTQDVVASAAQVVSS